MRKEKKYILVLSARDKKRLAEQAKSLLNFLRRKAYEDNKLLDICYTLQIGREVMESRAVFLVDTMSELIAMLEAFCENNSEGEYVYVGEGEVAETKGRIDFSNTNEIAKQWATTGNVNWKEFYRQNGLKPRVVGLPSYCFDKSNYWMPISTVKKNSNNTETLFYEEIWKPCNPVSSTVEKEKGTVICFVSDENYEEIKSYLNKKTDNLFDYVFVKQGYGIKTIDKDYYTVRPEYTELQQLFQMMQDEYESIYGILYLWSMDVDLENGGRYFEKAAEMIKGAAKSKVAFKKILIAGGYKTWQERCYSETLVSFEKAVPMILPETTVKTVCISTEKNEINKCLELLLNEFNTQEKESVLYENEERKHLTLIEKKTLETDNNILKKNGVYCITGGVGGIGKVITSWLLKEYKATVILLGRRGKEEVISQIENLSVNGGIVDYIQADVCNYAALEKAVQQVTNLYGTINGIFHAAGLEGKKSILITEREEFLDVLSPKLEGTINLIQAVSGVNYDFMCLCSSNSAMLGDFGNCAYSLGNRFLMLAGKYYDARIKVINWPLWKDGGMGKGDNEAQKMYLKSSGQVALENEEAIRILTRFLNSPYKQILAMVGERKRIEAFLLKQQVQPQRKKSINKKKVKRNTTGISRRKAFMSDWTVEDCVIYELKEATNKILQIPLDDMGEDENLADFGYDSITLAEFSSIVTECFGEKITPDVFFSYPTLGRLGRYIYETYNEKMDRLYQQTDFIEELIEEVDETDCNKEAFVEEQAVLKNEKIAIVGMSGRFPGAKNVEELWQLIKNGKEAIEQVPKNRTEWWNGKNESDYDYRMGVISNIKEFDSLFFEIAPSEAETMDPQQRVILEEIWKALENAGYGKRLLEEEKIGVFVGAEDGDYKKIISDDAVITSNNASMLSARIAYFLNLKGPNLTVNTACSSGLTAAHQAVLSLQNGECDSAIVAGVSLECTSSAYDSMDRAGMLAEDRRCYAFDRKASGMVPAEAAAVLILKRESKAKEDGNYIYATVVGSGINYDGRTNGITAPSGESQKTLLSSVYERYHINPEDIGLIMAHGTGTRLGDPIEMNALVDAFKLYTNKKKYCSVSSIKSNIGHSLAASGLVSVIALINAMQEKVLPPQINCDDKSEYIKWEDSPFYINDKLRIWDINAKGTRMGAASAFGMGGTNVHFVIENSEPIHSLQNEKPYYLIVVSAKTEKALEEKCTQLADYLEFTELPLSMKDIEFTLLEGRVHFKHRYATVAANKQEAIKRLRERKLYTTDTFQNKIKKTFKPQEVVKNQVKETLNALVSAKENIQEYHNHLNVLAKLYCEGYELDGRILYEDRNYRRVKLPNYPFEKDICWAEEHNQGKEKITEQKYENNGFIWKNYSNLNEIKYEAILDGDAFYFKDHIIGNNPTFPGVAYLEIARQTAELAYGLQNREDVVVALHNIGWMSPIVCEEKQKQTVYITLEESSEQELSFNIYTVEDSGNKSIKCQGTLEVFNRETEYQEDIEQIQGQAKEIFDAELCYDKYQRQSIKYGKNFQCIKNLYVSEDCVLSHLEMPKGQSMNSYSLIPGIVDGALQSIMGFALLDGTEYSDAKIPFSLEDVTIYHPCKNNMWAIVYRGTTTGKVEKYDVDLLDENGVLCVELRGYTSVVLPKDNTTKGFVMKREQIPVSFLQEKQSDSERVDICIGLKYVPENVISLSYLKENNALDKWYQDVLMDVMLQTKKMMHSQYHSEKHLQVVIPNNEENILLSSIESFFRSASKENPLFHGKVIEIAKTESAEAVKKILDAESNDRDNVHVIYKQGKRFVERFSLVELPKAKTKPWKDNGVYLITGGNGGLGRTFAKEIAYSVKEPVILLVGRKSLDEGGKEFINKLNSMGSRVVYSSLNVTKKDEVSSFVYEAVKTYGKIDGILHCAGTINDNYLVKKTEEEFCATLAPKVSGIVQLDEATKELDLDFFISFSSITGAIGNAGQTDYAAANAFMDKYIVYRNKMVKKGIRKGTSVSINWPLWKDGGMHVDKASEKMLADLYGTIPMPTNYGVELFYSIWSNMQRTDKILENAICMYGKNALLQKEIEKLSEIHGNPVIQKETSVCLFQEDWIEEELQKAEQEDRVIVCVAQDRAFMQTVRSEADICGNTADIIWVICDKAYEKKSIYEYCVDYERKEDYIQVLEEIKGEFGSIDSILYLNPLNNKIFLQDVSGIISILQAIAKTKLKVRKILLAGGYEDELERAYADSLIGMEKTICNTVLDLSIGVVIANRKEMDCASFLHHMLRECDSKQTKSVWYDNGIRKVQAVNPIENLGENTSVIKKYGTYVILGGMGGLGLVFADYLSKEYNANLVLSGRRSAKEVETQLTMLKQNGMSVCYVQADVSNQEQLENVKEIAKKSFGKIDGVIHAAGIPEGKNIVEKNYEDFQSVLKPKVQGVIALEKAFQNESIDFICYFSSVSATLGDFGSFDYAMGSRFMLCYGAHQNKTTGYKVVVIEWPYWKDGGMSFKNEAAEQMYLNASGQVGLRGKEGTRIFEQILGSTLEHCLVMYGNQKRIERIFGINSEEKAEEKQTVPIKNALNTERRVEVVKREKSISMNNMPDKQMDNQRTTEAINILKRVISKILKISENRIDEENSMEEYGLNSIIILDLIKELEVIFGSLPKTLFYEYTTLKELAEYFATQYASVLNEKREKENPISEQNKSDISVKKELEHKRSSVMRRPRRQSIQPKATGITQTTNTNQSQDVAIIGLSGTYPKAKDMNEFWENLKAGLDCIEEVPEERWNNEAYRKRMGEKKTFSQYGGFIKDVDKFDPLFFHISPREAERTDPQERLFLEYVYKAIEDAGYTKKQIEKIGNIGVYVGSMYSEYQYYGVEEQMRGNMVAYTGTLSSIANRVSYYLNIHGPSLAIDTMCSSSLTAIYLACQEISRGRCDMMIAGGVNLSIHPNKYVMLAQNNFSSSTGRCVSFGEGGDGYVPSEGVGAVILKPLAKAIEDGDHIYGVIKAIEANHGGKTTGYSVPNPNAQTDVIVRALESASINPETINYIEAHGTGTALGDPIEITSLTNAYRKYTDKTGICTVGSVKSNIGHCEGAAGISALSKVLLQLKHKQIVPSIHSEKLNPYINFEETPFKVPHQLKKWEHVTVEENGSMKEYPLRAGIQAFGAGGSNVHMIVEEYQKEKNQEFEGPYGIVISAQTQNQVKELAMELLEWVSKGIYTNQDMASIAYTLQTGREAMDCRLAFCADNLEELTEKLNAYLNGNFISSSGIYVGTIQEENNDLARIFSGAELVSIIKQWMENGKLEKILECWAKGMKIEWNELYQQGRPDKISLPTYPFLRKRCWVETKNDWIEENKAEDKIKVSESEIVYIQEDWIPIQESHKVVKLLEPNDIVLWIINRETNLDAIYDYIEGHKIQGKFIFAIRSNKYRQISDDVYEVSFENSSTLAAGIGNIIEAQQGRIQYVIYWGADSLEYGFEQLPEVGYLYKALKENSLALKKLVIAGRYQDEKMRCCIEALIGYEKSARMLMPKTGVILIGAEKQSITFEQFIEKTLESCVEDINYIQMMEDGIWKTNQLQESLPILEKSSLKQDGVYFITGGLGGIGIIVAQWLLKKYHAKVVLTGRSINEEKQRKLDRLSDLYGERVQFIKADVCVKEDMKSAVQKTKQIFGTLNGVIHAAGVEGKSKIYDADDQEFLKIISPKVQGTLILNEILKDEAVDMICYFSSTSALLGDFGDCAYSTGNRFMMRYAKWQSRVEKDKAIYVINWPLWRDGGMGHTNDSAMDMYLKSSGLRLLESEEGLECLETVFCQNQAQLAVFAGDKKRIQGMLKPQTNQPKRQLSVKKSKQTIKIESTELKGALLEMLKQNVSKLMKIDEEQIGYDILLADYGFDSISLSEYADILNDILGIEVLPDIFFSYPTLLKFGEWMLEEHQEKLKAYFQLSHKEKEDIEIEENLEEQQILAEQVYEKEPKSSTSDKQLDRQDADNLIAVVGMSGRFPGADNIEQLWDILQDGKIMIDEVPKDRTLWHKDNKVRKMGGLSNIHKFDPLFFEIPPSEAETMDPRQRLLLEESWKALEMAGYGEKLLEDEEIGMFVGAEDSTYGMVTNYAGGITSNHNAMMAARLAYFLDMKGPNMTINTACSSGLSAVHEACLSIRSGECDAAVAAGANLFFTPGSYDLMENAGMLSPTQTCYAFDNRADGMVPGEGVAVVVLKRLSLAIQDNNQILAVIKGSGMNYDGRTNGITAPSAQSQVKLLTSVYNRFNIKPEDIGYVIAHGTGTKLGDPMEMNALTEAFAKYTSKKQYCAVGSIKPNIGHGLAASGVCSLIAMVLALQNEMIPPQVNCEEESSYIQWKNSPFYLNLEKKFWKDREAQKRIGAVSSFGMGGTNVHVVLESAKMYEQVTSKEQKKVHIIPISAKTKGALERMRQSLIDYLESNKGTVNLDDVSYTLLEGRKHFLYRICVVASNCEEAIEQLKNQEPEKVSRKFLKEEKVQLRINQLEEMYCKTENEGALIKIAEELVSYYNMGYAINGEQLWKNYSVARIILPSYSFERSEYCAEIQGNEETNSEETLISEDVEIMTVYLGIANPPEGEIVLGKLSEEKDIQVQKNKMERIIDVILTSENPSNYGLHIIAPNESRQLYQFAEEIIIKARMTNPKFKGKIIFVPAKSTKAELANIADCERNEVAYQNVMYENGIRNIIS